VGHSGFTGQYFIGPTPAPPTTSVSVGGGTAIVVPSNGIAQVGEVDPGWHLHESTIEFPYVHHAQTSSQPFVFVRFDLSNENLTPVVATPRTVEPLVVHTTAVIEVPPSGSRPTRSHEMPDWIAAGWMALIALACFVVLRLGLRRMRRARERGLAGIPPPKVEKWRPPRPIPPRAPSHPRIAP
jgi:hypothetical protein